jgi:hypothetical protein
VQVQVRWGGSWRGGDYTRVGVVVDGTVVSGGVFHWVWRKRCFSVGVVQRVVLVVTVAMRYVKITVNACKCPMLHGSSNQLSTLTFTVERKEVNKLMTSFLHRIAQFYRKYTSYPSSSP